MKNTIKTILLFFTAALLITSCGEDSNPPTAGFSMSDMNPIQWGTSTIASTAIGADEISYSVSPSSHVWIDAATIQFLEDTSYTITQTVLNEDGEDASSLTVVVTEPDNTYSIDGTSLPITAAPSWVPANEAHETKALLHFISDVEGQDEPNHIKLSPILGLDPLEGTYTYNSDKETIGTYYTRVISNFAGGVTDPSDWTTNFGGEDGGSDLVIELVYEDTDSPDNNAYEFTITSYILSTGHFDWSTFSFVEEAKRPFTLKYRGVVIPVVAP